MGGKAGSIFSYQTTLLPSFWKNMLIHGITFTLPRKATLFLWPVDLRQRCTSARDWRPPGHFAGHHRMLVSRKLWWWGAKSRKESLKEKETKTINFKEKKSWFFSPSTFSKYITSHSFLFLDSFIANPLVLFLSHSLARSQSGALL